MKRIYTLFFIILCWSLPSAKAQSADSTQGFSPIVVDTAESVATPPSTSRPKVGVALSGGGAKGVAHIGVLKYLVEQGIPIDYVAGTSMGSIIGGLYSLGYTPDEMTVIIGQMDWSLYMSDIVERKYLSSIGRRHRDTYLFNIPFNAGTLKHLSTDAILSSLPSGFVSGNNISNLLSSLSVGYNDSTDFNLFPTPFACVATDVKRCKPVVFRSGCFPEVIRSSMAIPGVFSPVYMNDMVLADGGLLDNFPTDICKEMGADIIIGVDVSDHLITQNEQLRSLPQLLFQYSNIAMCGDVDDSRQLCDIYIRPDISGYGSLSFTNQAIDSLIQRGYRQAQLHHDELMALKHQLGDIDTPQPTLSKASRFGTDTVILSALTFDSVDANEYKWLCQVGGIREGMAVNKSTIDEAAFLIAGTGTYTDICYHVRPLGHNRVAIQFHMKPTEPHNFAVGMRIDSEESTAMLFHLGLNENRPTARKLLIDTRLSNNPRIALDAVYSTHSPLTHHFAYTFQNSLFNVARHYDLGYNTMTVGHHNLNLSFSHGLTRRSTLRFGAEEDLHVVDADLESNEYFFYRHLTGIFISPGHLGPFASFRFDNLNECYFPTSGSNVIVDLHWRFSNAGIYMATHDHSDDHYLGFGEVKLSCQKAITPTTRLTLVPQLFTRVVMGEHRESYDNMIGGVIGSRYLDQQLPFVGFNTPQMVDDYAHVLRLDCRYQIVPSHYLTLMTNYLMAADKPQHYFSDTGYHEALGLGLRYSYNPPFGGPLSVDLHWSTLTRRLGLYFNLGFIF